MVLLEAIGGLVVAGVIVYGVVQLLQSVSLKNRKRKKS